MAEDKPLTIGESLVKPYFLTTFSTTVLGENGVKNLKKLALSNE